MPSELDGEGKPHSLAQILLAGVVTIVIPAAAAFLWAWSTGQGYVPAGATRRPAPMSSEAAFEGAIMAYLAALFLGLPLFGLWCVVCVVKRLVSHPGRIK